MYVIVLILKDKEASEEFKTLAFASGMLAVLMPIGSNVGITHLCNEAFFCTAIYCNLYRRQNEKGEETD